MTRLLDALAHLDGVLGVCWLDTATGVTLERRAPLLDELAAARDTALLAPLGTLSTEADQLELMVMTTPTRVTVIHAVPSAPETVLWVCFDPRVGQLGLVLQRIRAQSIE